MDGRYAFDRPVIILSAPRSGSTLLFETLSISKDFWTIGGESHGVFEGIRDFCEVSADGILDSISTGLKYSRYTLTPPVAIKWHKNSLALKSVMPDLQEMVDYIRQVTDGIPEDEFDLNLASVVKTRDTNTATAI